MSIVVRAVAWREWGGAARAVERPWRATAADALAVVVVASVMVMVALSLDDSRPMGLAQNASLALAFAYAGRMVARAEPKNPVGWLLLLVAVGQSCGVAGSVAAELIDAGAEAEAQWLLWLQSWMWVLILAPVPLLVLLFPSGAVHSRVERLVAAAGVAVIAAAPVALALTPGPLEGVEGTRNPLAGAAFAGFAGALWNVAATTWVVAGVVAIGLAVVRMRRSTGVERAQLRWFAAASAVVLVVFGAPVSFPPPLWAVLVLVAPLLLPLAVSIAVVRHDLYDIDVLIDRALLYGTLLVAVVGLHLALVAGARAVLDLDESLGALAATGVAVVAVQPLRSRAERVVRRLIHGHADDPAAAVIEVGRHLAVAAGDAPLLEGVCEAITTTLRLTGARIEVFDGAGAEVAAASWGSFGASMADVPLVVSGQAVGRLTIGMRSRLDRLGEADHRTLSALAGLAAAAALSVRATIEVERSRRAILDGREEERRRLRRDLHDGLGPTLGGVTMTVDTARVLVPPGNEQLARLLGRVVDQVKAAVGDVRHLVDDLRPPALEQTGLVEALEQRAVDLSGAEGRLHVTVRAEELGSLPAVVEVAAYRIACEAIENCARHAGARTCRVMIGRGDGDLRVDVVDDGIGLHDQRRSGVGLASMRERAAELGGTCVVRSGEGGGTVVSARLPVSVG